MKTPVKRHINRICQTLQETFRHLYYRFTSKYNASNYKQIPIIINNFNRLGYLKKLIPSLQRRGYTNLIILDNASTYPPLVEWYKNECNVRVICLDDNYGHTALWTSGAIEEFKNDYFVYTDPDLELVDECPEDFLYQMLQKLKAHVKGQKIGLSLKIDDILDSYKFKADVLKQEQPFYEKMEYGMYVADVDTTFALYEPYADGGYVDDIITYRMPYPIQCRHLPWYEDVDNISEEDRYYVAHKKTTIGWWSSKLAK